MVGMGAVVGEGCVIEEGAIIGAASVLPAGTRVPTYEVLTWFFLPFWIRKERTLSNGFSFFFLPHFVRAPQYWAGNPAKFVRMVTQEEKDHLVNLAESYYTTSQKHKQEFLPYTTAYIDLEELYKRAAKLS
jgi:carbonic anhydrase/acetyltransferase-like protein (isoleucine patch superfamily)